MMGSDAKAVTVMVSGYIESALTDEIKQKLAEHGVEIIRVDDEEPEIDRVREIVFMNSSPHAVSVGAAILEKLNRQICFNDVWNTPIGFAELNEFCEPVAYKLPKYKQPARATMRPRQSVLRGK